MAASEEDLKAFSSQVQNCANRLQVLVHPYFEDGLGIIKGEDYKTYLQRQERFINACVSGGVPIIIFEEQGSIMSLLANLPISDGKLYVVETKPRTWEPVAQEDASYILARFQEAGVSYVAVGGMYMEINSHGEASGCAGEFVGFLRKSGVETVVSSSSYPDFLRGGKVVRASGFGNDLTEFHLEL